MAKETRKPISREKAEKIVGGQGDDATSNTMDPCTCSCPTHCSCVGHTHV